MTMFACLDAIKLLFYCNQKIFFLYFIIEVRKLIVRTPKFKKTCSIGSIVGFLWPPVALCISLWHPIPYVAAHGPFEAPPILV
jgi:hypothetical protein